MSAIKGGEGRGRRLMTNVLNFVHVSELPP